MDKFRKEKNSNYDREEYEFTNLKQRELAILSLDEMEAAKEIEIPEEYEVLHNEEYCLNPLTENCF